MRSPCSPPRGSRRLAPTRRSPWTSAHRSCAARSTSWRTSSPRWCSPRSRRRSPGRLRRAPAGQLQQDRARPLPRASLPEPAPAERTAGPHAAGSIYVDAAKGSDSAAGSLGAPLKTIEAAHAKTRQRVRLGHDCAARRHILPQGDVALTAQDSGLTIESYTGEVAEVSGAHPLGKLAWTAHNTSGGQNVYSAKLPSSALPSGDMTGLRVDGKRGIRARWPNGDPEYQLFPDGWVADNGWQKPKPSRRLRTSRSCRRTAQPEGPCASVNGYCYYTTGVGGACAGYGFEPPSATGA